MVAYRALKTLTQNGTLTLESLPFPAGAQVEVIVLPVEPRASDENPAHRFGGSAEKMRAVLPGLRR